MVVGLLGLQGAFLDHRHHVARLGHSHRVVRDLEDLAAVDRLIIPGGESTVMAMYLKAYGLVEPLKERIAAGMPVWGICAGAILLAESVDNGPGILKSLGVTVRRNAYGRQDASDVHAVDVSVLDRPAFPALFIRAPRITACGPGVSVLATHDQAPVFVRQGTVMATTFHPELTDDAVFHDYFLGF
ncbi:pyridoxal 5'-phosphate synthase glutaminase subunit PdxT [Desulfosarcina ovata]|uniref:Pyridoxal 5'-phosphate synthase subunit PdxT n=1 Tax=Desulfosarcina ovata subsp. ovata TaxID=2752305 RepID=A0A5K8ADR1_9BACT|nr:pyridoxal 5'-phosphate synthase glutaminase subunit PdxT [Desulfosarcina ovata]BBO90628.1 pyridoxal 5'-phosphate synthase subunit PdxT [Desulfosarcina ovata subsp. ovata]